MQAYGSDRLRIGDNGQLILGSRFTKGWVPRVEKTLTTAEFPGTAIRWEEQYFEVVSAEGLPNGGVRYVLEPWLENNVMRVSEPYDAPSEALRLEEYRKRLQREKHRKTANALGMFTGHLPAMVQESLASELGLLPTRLTLASTFLEWLVIAALVLYVVSRITAGEPPPLVPAIAAIYLGIENAIRLNIVWLQGRPIGSTIGMIVYLVYYAITRRGVSPFAEPKGSSIASSEAPPDVAARDALAMREALVTLLTPAEQARVAERYGYDYKRESAIVAGGILFFALIGIASSWSSRDIIGFVIAVVLAGEQIVRLAAFRRGPAGSVLRFLVRPFVRKLLK